MGTEVVRPVAPGATRTPTKRGDLPELPALLLHHALVDVGELLAQAVGHLREDADELGVGADQASSLCSLPFSKPRLGGATVIGITQLGRSSGFPWLWEQRRPRTTEVGLDR